MTIICDIDGTIADLTHRLHYVTAKHKDWDSFFRLVGGDKPIWPVIHILDGADEPVLLVSGRPEKTRIDTEDWLQSWDIKYNELYMRPDGDTRPDHIVKSQILDGILADGHDISLVLDDRPTVISMWKERGLFVLTAPWHGDGNVSVKPGNLTIMVGPSGAGKTTWLKTMNQQHVVSSDQLREDLTGSALDQTKNDEVFAAFHSVIRSRLSAGLPAIADATHLKRKDRLATVACAPEGSMITYIVIDRPMEDKIRDGAWRNAVPGLIERHDTTFKSQLKDILSGDGLPNVNVLDLRK